eukprot:tig00000385_g24763.t1
MVGDYLYYDLPKDGEKSRSFGNTGKRLLAIRKLKLYNVTPDKPLDGKMLDAYDYARTISRVFGRAMSKAKPGKELDGRTRAR